MRNFFWGSSSTSPPVAWEQVCSPKSKGGLGIRPVSCFNKAALAKLGWKVITDHNNWWVEIVRKKYLWKFSFFDVPKQPHQSFAWKGILDSRDIILKGMRWIIGNGRNIKFWTFNWIYDFPLIQLVDENTRPFIDLDESVLDYFDNGVWNIDKLNLHLDSSIVRDISFVNLPFSDREDEFVWGPASDGKFSIKSATWFQCNQNVHPKANLLNKIWKLNLPPKAKIFAWLLVRDRLKTRARLSRFNSNINPVCGLCNNDVETSDHIFWSCPKVWDVWTISNLNHNPTTFNCFDDWIVSIVRVLPGFCSACFSLLLRCLQNPEPPCCCFIHYLK
ncbi:putative reverse transcriptase zinc-binding domain-containing protein [Rosa chinensis]|uniref:Putative reverse transcriptase zinc-binding domain-containing protein n=1 Tax=Rosa chinensis TaxID=74649 RepID=A0A2P6PYT0_ROSCH|nr:putative reverse transcriptase zinc-binding domain-containing protein [Rosa chinensis]